MIYIYIYTLMLTDVQAPFLGTPSVPRRGSAMCGSSYV